MVVSRHSHVLAGRQYGKRRAQLTAAVVVTLIVQLVVEVCRETGGTAISYPTSISIILYVYDIVLSRTAL